MTSPSPSFLDFFVLEAGEYVEQLDGILLLARTGALDSDALRKTARALRGSATMAKLGMFAELASTLEALGRALKQGSLAFNPALKGALAGAVDDLRILVRAARTWTARENQLVVKRIGELSQFAGIQPAYAASVAGSDTASGHAYFAAEAGSLAAELAALVARPPDRPAALNVLQRVRALRGVAGVREVPALAEASDAAESAVRPLELSDGPLPGVNLLVLRAAGELLRAVSNGLSTGRTVTTATPQYQAFLSALDAMLANESGADRVIPIADLHFDDRGPHVVTASPNPPTTPAQRFRMEVVSLGEHLHRVIDEARSATDDIQREHAKGGLGRALRAIRATAASFGQMAVVQTVEDCLERTGDLGLSALDAISTFASTISPAATAPTPLATSAVGLRMSAVRGAVAALGSPPPAPAARRPSRPITAATVASLNATPSAPGLSASLDASIAAFDSLALERMAEPTPLDDALISVDALQYRGRAALDRAIELRDGLRSASGAPAADVLEEIYDLLGLARVESPAF